MAATPPDSCAARRRAPSSLRISSASLPPAALAGKLRWPLPALLLWAACWALHGALLQAGAGAGPAWALACALGAAAALLAHSRWRQWMLALGFPLSALAAGAGGGLPPWAWLLPLALLLLAYPLRAWRDAPVFPTPRQALRGLAQIAPLPAGAGVFDAGCGLGHGLRALRHEYPDARLSGIEWSWPLTWLARAGCRGARIRRGDMWGANWSGHALVYVFQRPESMARVWDKACAELAAGSWLVSLAFEIRGMAPFAVLREGCDGRELPVWIYRIEAHRSHGG